MHGHHNQGVGKNTDYDRGHAIHQVSSISYNKWKCAPAELRQINSPKQADGNAEQGCKEEELEAAQNRVSHASTLFADRRGKMREETPRQVFSAVIHQIAEDKEQDRYGNQHANSRKREHENVERFSPRQSQAHEGSTPLPRAVVTRIRRRASPFRMKVSRNSTSPSSIRALKYKLPVASENSLASTAAIE